MKEESVFSTRQMQTEAPVEDNVRPDVLDEFIGQNRVKENLLIGMEAARRRGEVMDHVLLSGPPGLGKTTLGRIIASHMNCELVATQGPRLEKTGDLAGILTNLPERAVLFIDEIHRLRPVVEECLYAAMEDYVLDVVIGEGPAARTLRMKLPRFTLIGATTREGLLSKPFRSRFGVMEKLEDYPWEDLAQIARRAALILQVELESPAAALLAKCSRGTPRLVNRFLRRMRDVAQIKEQTRISLAIVQEGLARLGVDQYGLDATDRKILETLLNHHGRPVGVKTLALVVGETEDTVEEIYEPFLLREGYITKTPQGRLPLDKARHALGRTPDAGPALFS